MLRGLGSLVVVVGGFGCAMPAATTPTARAGTLPEAGENASGANSTVPSAEQSPELTAAIAGIQQTLDRQSAAVAKVDRDAFMATVDQRNLTWRRIQGDVFASETARGPRSATTLVVTQVQPKQNGYVKAWIDITPPGARQPQEQAVWVFRNTEKGWLHSEILNEEIGRRKSLETEHFALSYYSWDDDIIERVAGVAERAYARVVERTGIMPEGLTAVSVNPTYGAHSGLLSYGTWAIFMPSTDSIAVRSLESYGAGTTNPGETQEDRLLIAFTHEFAHLVNNRIISTARIPKWMVEGFAEYVAENLRAGSIIPSLRSGNALTLDKASEIIEWGTDPSKGFTHADVNRAYGYSAHAVTYFMERFGQDVFFEMAKHFAESRRWEESFAAVTGTNWADFERERIEWARKRYGI